MIKKIFDLFNNYVYGRWISHKSTAAFWYLPETPNVVNRETLDKYYESANPSPIYLMNYIKKLSYNCKNDDGIIVLNYGEPFGTQINPEAAFQYALGLHDLYLQTKQNHVINEFMKYADYFCRTQTDEGYWLYNFDYGTTNGCWASALAQSRGCSVMLRAWTLTGDSRYLDSAVNAIKLFDTPIEEGGFLSDFPLVPECFYYDEYPQLKSAVINGFMSSLFCLWELSQWTNNKMAHNMWEKGIKSLEQILPFYTLSWWTLYDRNLESTIHNFNSPRYHVLEINYLKILTTLSNSNILEQHLERRLKQYRMDNIIKAFLLKTKYKIRYR